MKRITLISIAVNVIIVGCVGSTNRTSVDELLDELVRSDYGRVPSDNVILLDISLSNFDASKEKYEKFYKQELNRFLKNTLIIHPGIARVAIVTFASNISVFVDGISGSNTRYTACDLLSEEGEFLKEIDLDNIKERMKTLVTEGLTVTENILRRGLSNRRGEMWRQSVWLFSDGWDAHELQFTNSTIDVATRMKRRGVEIYTVNLPSSYARHGNLRPLVTRPHYGLTYDEWRELTDRAGAMFLRGNVTSLATPAAPCAVNASTCGSHASCYCDCLAAVVRCACDPGYAPRDGMCTECPVSSPKPEAGNQTCGSCVRLYATECSAGSSRANSLPWYLAIVIVAVCGTAVVVILIFLVCYLRVVRKHRKRMAGLVQPPHRDDLDTQIHRQEEQQRSAHGYANREMLSYFPDVIQSAHAHQRSMTRAIDLSHSHIPNSNNDDADRPMECNSNNQLQSSRSGIENAYQLTPNTSKVPSMSQGGATVFDSKYDSVTGDRVSRDSEGYVKPVKGAITDDDDENTALHEYVNVAMSNDYKEIDTRDLETSGIYANSTADVSTQEVSGETDLRDYVNESELEEINKSVVNKIKARTPKGSPSAIKGKPTPKPRTSTSHSADNSPVGTFKPSPGTVAQLKSKFSNDTDDNQYVSQIKSDNIGKGTKSGLLNPIYR